MENTSYFDCRTTGEQFVALLFHIVDHQAIFHILNSQRRVFGQSMLATILTEIGLGSSC